MYMLYFGRRRRLRLSKAIFCPPVPILASVHVVLDIHPRQSGPSINDGSWSGIVVFVGGRITASRRSPPMLSGVLRIRSIFLDVQMFWSALILDVAPYPPLCLVPPAVAINVAFYSNYHVFSQFGFCLYVVGR